MADAQRPLLPLPSAEPAAARQPARGGGNQARPKKSRLAEKLGPRFAVLQAAIDARRAELATTPAGVSPEHVVVFETNAPDASHFVRALRATPELTWLAGHDLGDVTPDDDFYDKEDRNKLLSARLFLVMANHAALQQLLALWQTWVASQRARLPPAYRAWGPAFRCLRDVRPWGSRDRIEETGLQEEWSNRARAGWNEWVPVEIELWFRAAATRASAAARVRAHVTAAGGNVVDEAAVEPIAYHALLAELPIESVARLLQDPTISLLKSDDVHLFRPVPQQPRRSAPPLDEAEPAAPTDAPAGTPNVALLDGLPLQNHALLRGRLVVDDPDDWDADYPAATRRHGTAMASLVLHGDRSTGNEPLTRPIYVRPIMRPRVFPSSRPEEAPRNELWVDVIHRAVLRIVGTGTATAAAPSVRVINLSIGDAWRPFIREVSPLARLLDWLAWEHKLLFVISAGNHSDEIVLEDGGEAIEVRTLRALQATHRHRRLLCPAESINGLTIGALHHDDAGVWERRNPDERELITTAGLPSPISALGRGHRRSVKPDIFAPGGRIVFLQDVNDTKRHSPSDARPRSPPGQRAAAPGARGVLNAEEFASGTSNAAALTTRAASQILDVLDALRTSQLGTSAAAVPEALLAKCLLVHTSTWPAREAMRVVETALRNEHNSHRWRDHVSGFVGFGALRTERALSCAATRATLVGGGALALGSAAQHRVPLPPGLNAHTGLRSLIVTLAWFSPTKPSERNYRVAALDAVVVAAGKALLDVEGQDVDGNAMKRGTLQHMVLRGDGSAVTVGSNDELIINVNAVADAEPVGNVIVPYALAVTIEVAETSRVQVYEEIATRIRTGVRVGTG